MPSSTPRDPLPMDEIRRLYQLAKTTAAADDRSSVPDIVQPLVDALGESEDAFDALATLIGRECFETEAAGEIIARMLDVARVDRPMLAQLGRESTGVRNWDFLNAAPPNLPALERLARRLQSAIEAPDDEHTVELHYALACCARVLGRRWDEVADTSHRVVAREQPENWQRHYDHGLFCKTRGKFAEGVAANLEAIRRGGQDNEAARWNLGICATGAGDGALALETWKGLGNKIEAGRFGLPEGGYPDTKVRLAQHPLAERSPESDAEGPGDEETVWVERLSPCHGIVRSVTYSDLGVDYGDVIAFDGAPVTYHKYGDTSVPVFPHLATLHHREYRLFNFAGTQAEPGDISKLSRDLPRDAVVYVHSEQSVILCACCWNDSELDHGQHRGTDHRVVHGQIAAPPDLPLHELRDALDRAVHGREELRICVPGLSDALGDDERTRVESRRYDLLMDN